MMFVWYFYFYSSCCLIIWMDRSKQPQWPWVNLPSYSHTQNEQEGENTNQKKKNNEKKSFLFSEFSMIIYHQHGGIIGWMGILQVLSAHIHSISFPKHFRLLTHTQMDSHRDTRHHSTPIPKQTQHENNLWQAMTTHWLDFRKMVYPGQPTATTTGQTHTTCVCVCSSSDSKQIKYSAGLEHVF